MEAGHKQLINLPELKQRLARLDERLSALGGYL